MRANPIIDWRPDSVPSIPLQDASGEWFVGLEHLRRTTDLAILEAEEARLAMGEPTWKRIGMAMLEGVARSPWIHFAGAPTYSVPTGH